MREKAATRRDGVVAAMPHCSAISGRNASRAGARGAFVFPDPESRHSVRGSRCPRGPVRHLVSTTQLLSLMKTRAGALETESIEGRLWIVEIGRIRVHQDADSD